MIDSQVNISNEEVFQILPSLAVIEQTYRVFNSFSTKAFDL